MKNYLKVDHKNGLLIMDKTFAHNSALVGSPEYNKLQNARRDYPEFQVTVRTIKKNPHKESYRGLTYAYMENYIATHDPTGQIAKEYAELRLITECHSIRYAHIKQWFLDTYPAVKQYSVHPVEEAAAAAAADIIPLPLSENAHDDDSIPA